VAANGEPILECVEVSKRFGGVHALERVSFTLRRGEVLALAGDNGAGKSTLIKVVSGVFRPDEGEIRYKGEPVAFTGPRQARERGIETIYQDLALADNLDVGENVFLGREPVTKVLGLLPRIDRRAMREAAHGVLSTPLDHRLVEPPDAPAPLEEPHAVPAVIPNGRRPVASRATR
jgi:simple sugar transport system ATP-binding protein